MGDYEFSGEADSLSRQHEYVRAATTLGVEAVAFGNDIASSQRDYWLSTFRIVRAVDNLVDERSDTDLPVVTSSLMEGAVPEPLEPELVDTLQQSLRTFSDEQRQTISEGLMAIGSFADAKRAARTPHQLAQVCLAEARYFASFLELPPSVNRSDDETARHKFNRWLCSIAQTGEMLDTAVDLRRDYQAGLIQVEPTRTDALLVAAHGLRYLPTALSGLRRSTIKYFASCTAACIMDR